jgi:hypothetical protein
MAKILKKDSIAIPKINGRSPTEREKRAAAKDFEQRWMSLLRSRTLAEALVKACVKLPADDATKTAFVQTFFPLMAANERVHDEPVDIGETIRFLQEHVEATIGFMMFWLMAGTERVRETETEKPSVKHLHFYRATLLLLAWGDFIGVPVPSCWLLLCETTENLPCTAEAAIQKSCEQTSARTLAVASGELQRMVWASYRKAGQPIPVVDPLNGREPTEIMGPKKFASIIGWSTDSLMRAIKDGIVPAKKHTAKSYQFPKDMIPKEKLPSTSPHKSA